MSAPRPKVVLLGMLTKMPVGGVAWLVAQYAVGFERLGYDVHYVEAHARTPSMFVEHEHEDGSERAAAYLDALMQRFGLGDRWAFHALHSDGRCYGMSATRLRRLYGEAALILNMHGGTIPLPEHSATGRLAYLGTDPVELELEVERGDQRALDFLDAHTAYFTWGLNHGNPDCVLPWSARHPFVPNPPPVVLDLWANERAPLDAPLTTIGNWRQHWRELTFQGRTYSWSKHHEFLKIIDLPGHVDVPLELALSSYEPSDRELLEGHGWTVRHGLDVSSDIDQYREYLTASRGELTAAKDQNVRFRSGWFSERSATYLATGRPVLMQDTGFGGHLPTGEGLIPFTDLDSAIAAVESVASDWKRHQRAALEIAREHLSYDVVLRSMLDHVGLPAPGRRRVRRAEEAQLPHPAPAAFPGWLRLEPAARRPLVLETSTEAHVVDRPVPVREPVGTGATPPLASVVVAAIDNEAVTRLALESVLDRTADVPYELIVVDNGSGPTTARYLSVLAARNRHVRVVRNEENLGFARAANQGLALARGEVVVLLNNDTMVTEGWLSTLFTHLADHPDIGLLGPVTNRCGNEAEVPTDYATLDELDAFAADLREGAADDPCRDIPVSVMFCTALRRDVLERVGRLDERFGLGMFEDDDYSHRVRDAGYRIACADDVFVHHFGEASLGWLAAAGRYGPLFEANRRLYEDKWGETWVGHHRQQDPAYRALVGRVREAVAAHVPDGAVVAVVSRGDDELLALPGREGRHLVAHDDGRYAGHHPRDDGEAVAHLERRRHEGATHLVVPASAQWWLEHYAGFAHHLQERYGPPTSIPDTAAIYALDPEEGP